MDVKEIFADLRERVSNPILLSFTISWCIWNYPIVVGLLFYSQKELAADGYQSYIQLIQWCYDAKKMFLYPFICAVGYVILFPPIRFLVKSFNAKFNDWTARSVNHFTEKSPYTKKEFRQRVKEQEQEMTEFTALSINNKATKVENDQLHSQLNSLKDAHQREINDLNASNDKRFQEQSSNGTERVTTLQKAHLEEIQLIHKGHEELIEDNERANKQRIEQLSAESIRLSNANQELSTRLAHCQNDAQRLEVENESVHIKYTNSEQDKEEIERVHSNKLFEMTSQFNEVSSEREHFANHNMQLSQENEVLTQVNKSLNLQLTESTSLNTEGTLIIQRLTDQVQNLTSIVEEINGK